MPSIRFPAVERYREDAASHPPGLAFVADIALPALTPCTSSTTCLCLDPLVHPLTQHPLSRIPTFGGKGCWLNMWFWGRQTFSLAAFLAHQLLLLHLWPLAPRVLISHYTRILMHVTSINTDSIFDINHSEEDNTDKHQVNFDFLLVDELRECQWEHQTSQGPEDQTVLVGEACFLCSNQEDTADLLFTERLYIPLGDPPGAWHVSASIWKFIPSSPLKCLETINKNTMWASNRWRTPLSPKLSLAQWKCGWRRLEWNEDFLWMSSFSCFFILSPQRIDTSSLDSAPVWGDLGTFCGDGRCFVNWFYNVNLKVFNSSWPNFLASNSPSVRSTVQPTSYSHLSIVEGWMPIVGSLICNLLKLTAAASFEQWHVDDDGQAFDHIDPVAFLLFQCHAR